MTVAYLGLGANLGDARQAIKSSILLLDRHQEINVLRRSSLYYTSPIEADGDKYFNCVIKIDTQLSAQKLLKLCHNIEHYFGRQRLYLNSPRTLDIDILLFNFDVINEPTLIIPHPRLTNRAFVLIPLLEINKTIDIPDLGRANAFLTMSSEHCIEKLKNY
ncbi:MAG: 2-amino-4-hydroxy-6-hydroxymethyldihydropteridine diphosphokinase [Burkholderia sp.]|nr:2-amino-4-hydroxy-6-hydroxymethyldihydropteridine diphosphokinase [Burkholderia sp.]